MEHIELESFLILKDFSNEISSDISEFDFLIF